MKDRREEFAQHVIDSIMAIQDEWPMPEDGKNQFIDDIEYTNKKRGWGLRINDERQDN